MANKISIWIFFFMISQASAQTEPCDRPPIDKEQKQLEICYYFSNIFGYNIHTIKYPKLFETVGEWLGTRYCYAGDSKNGVDCSGFVSALFKSAFDVELEGSSGDIFKNIKSLKKSQLREGDMVFFRIKNKKVSHMGIFLGQNKFAHASLKLGVIVSDLNEPYYRKYFYKGGRVN